MKVSFSTALALLLASSALAFAPSTKPGTAASLTELRALADNIFGMDLFDRDGNKYGARAKKNLKVKELGSNSYVPNGLSKAEYEKIRKAEFAKKQQNYQKNVAKAGKFLDFTNFYKARGTEEGGSWLKAPARGHQMVKTKYDWAGVTDAKKFESTNTEKFTQNLFGGAKKTAAAPATKKSAPKKLF